MVERACRVCGCTDARACWPTCWWVEPNLCSACARAPDEHPAQNIVALFGEGLDLCDGCGDVLDEVPLILWEAGGDGTEIGRFCDACGARLLAPVRARKTLHG